MKKIGFVLFAFFSIAIGLYPLAYFILDPKFGLLDSKPLALFENQVWYAAFYAHILLGGLSLLVGWPQFHADWRRERPDLHRFLGKIYLIAVLLSGAAGFYIAYFATGGIGTKLGFATLAVLWLYTSARAYLSVRQKNFFAHQKWMIFSFALCWAAVTLRLWLPLLTVSFRGDFLRAYALVAWLSWVPNLLVAWFIVRRMRK